MVRRAQLSRGAATQSTGYGGGTVNRVYRLPITGLQSGKCVYAHV